MNHFAADIQRFSMRSWYPRSVVWLTVQFLDGKLLFSASGLVNYLGCRHATYLDLRSLADEVAISERDTLRLVWIWTKL